MIIFGKHNRRNKMGHPNHLDGSVDKGEDFVNEGMTLITETDSDKYLNMSAKRNRNKAKNQEVFDSLEWADGFVGK
jgi:hypothetical protein